MDGEADCVQSSQYRNKIKEFLASKVRECEKIIQKRKIKNKTIKILYTSFIATSIVGSSVVVLLSSLSIPPIAIGCVSALTTITSALSIKFNLQDKKNKLEHNIQNLNKIRDKLDYVISCNGDLTEEECNEILREFRVL